VRKGEANSKRPGKASLHGVAAVTGRGKGMRKRTVRDKEKKELENQA